jgi:hypothetical protein
MPSSPDETLENRTLLAAPKRIPPVGSLGACRGAEKRVTPFRGSFLQFIVSIHISGMIDDVIGVLFSPSSPPPPPDVVNEAKSNRRLCKRRRLGASGAASCK